MFSAFVTLYCRAWFVRDTLTFERYQRLVREPVTCKSAQQWRQWLSASKHRCCNWFELLIVTNDCRVLIINRWGRSLSNNLVFFCLSWRSHIGELVISICSVSKIDSVIYFDWNSVDIINLIATVVSAFTFGENASSIKKIKY